MKLYKSLCIGMSKGILIYFKERYCLSGLGMLIASIIEA